MRWPILLLLAAATLAGPQPDPPRAETLDLRPQPPVRFNPLYDDGRFIGAVTLGLCPRPDNVFACGIGLRTQDRIEVFDGRPVTEEGIETLRDRMVEPGRHTVRLRRAVRWDPREYAPVDLEYVVPPQGVELLWYEQPCRVTGCGAPHEPAPGVDMPARPAKSSATPRRAARIAPLILTACAFFGCDDDPALTADAARDMTVDTGPLADAAPDMAPEAPQWQPAPPADTPMALQGETWKSHWTDDIRPYWAVPAALGEPLGNYPTYRDMDGGARPPSDRRPRMLGRQIYTYTMGYALTGDPQLLEWAAAGVDWMLDHARDIENGGWYPLLNAAGDGIGGAKTAQDTAYAVMGLAAWYFVTRDPRAEQALNETRDLLFDAFVDADTGRLVDGLSSDLQSRFDVEGDGGWELVAQLDPINAFMLLVQPVLSDADRRRVFLDDMLRLGDVMVEHFWADGIFWGVHDQQGRYGARHVDFGHTLKSYWMLYMLARRAPRADWHALIEEHGMAWLAKAYDAENGRWAKRPTSADGVEYGSDWWIYAEADQFAASLSMVGRGDGVDLAATAGHWIEDYVDPQPPGGIIPGIGRAGQPVFGWPRSDTAKCNQWKSGYHATEHALVLYLHGRDREGLPATLHFAVPPDDADGFIARPYLYDGTETDRRAGEELMVGGRALRAVAVDFVDIY